MIYKRRKLMLLFGLALAIVSCEYEEYQDADYPEQLIYMPAANYNPFEINDVEEKTDEHPTEGNIWRYEIDAGNGIFTVPLGVYRSGIDTKGSFGVDIAVNRDTITKLFAAGELDTATVKMLPTEEFTLPSSITMGDGVGFEPFYLDIDLDFLQENAPDMKYAIGVQISSDERETNPDLELTILVIHTEASMP